VQPTTSLIRQPKASGGAASLSVATTGRLSVAASLQALEVKLGFGN
jgi:hypothetical protein